MSTSITEQMGDLRKRIEGLRQDLLKRLSELPDNPRITRRSDKCFTINVKDIGPGAILSPFYHDFKAQYKEISEIIEEETLEDASKKIDTIIKTGSLMYKNKAMHFHPDVITNLKEGLR